MDEENEVGIKTNRVEVEDRKRKQSAQPLLYHTLVWKKEILFSLFPARRIYRRGYYCRKDFIGGKGGRTSFFIFYSVFFFSYSYFSSFQRSERRTCLDRRRTR